MQSKQDLYNLVNKRIQSDRINARELYIESTEVAWESAVEGMFEIGKTPTQLLERMIELYLKRERKMKLHG